MPVLHVLVNLRRDAALTVVLLVECGVHMVNNHTEITLQGVVVDRALPVPVNAVVYVCDDCLDRPVRDAHGRILGDLTYNFWLEWTAMSEDPIGLIIRHRCPMPVLLFQHLLNNLGAVLVARGGDISSFLDALKSEYLERSHSGRCLWVEWLTRKAEALSDTGIGPHEDIVKEPAEYPSPQTHRLHCQADVLNH